MPSMDGYQCTKFASALLRLTNVRTPPKIVAVTGHIEPEY